MGTAVKAIGRGVGNFIAVTGLIVLYLTALTLVAMAILKPIMPEQVGFWTGEDLLLIGIVSDHVVGGMGLVGDTTGATEHLGYWIIPLSLVAGAVVYLMSNSFLRRFLKSMRRERP
jgi:hypothetical protein